MTEEKQPAISYRGSIWLFSFLLLILFGVFSLGAGLNIMQMGREWRYAEFNHFISTAAGIQLILTHSEDGTRALSGEWDSGLQAALDPILQPYKLNASDRVFLVFRESLRQVLPVARSSQPPSGFPPEIPAWSSGWNGIHAVAVEYTSVDSVPVLASVVPEKFSVAGPGVLIVVERKMEVFNRIDRQVRFLLFLCIFGLVSAYVLVIYYGRKMLRPFNRLEQILQDAASVKTDVMSLADHYRDPVQRSIETFSVAVTRLLEQEERLELLSNRLEESVSPEDEYESDVLASVNAGIVTFDTRMRIQSYTGKIPELLHLGDRDICGMFCADVFGHGSVLCSVVSVSLKQKTPIRQRQWNWEPPGNPPIWFSLSTLLIRSPGGAVKGIGCVIRDITLLKRLRHQIREKEHLAALGELSAGIAHELRNPLGAIQGNAEYLAGEISEEELSQIALEIRNEVLTLERIIRDFLSFARPSVPDVSPVDLKALIQEELRSVEAMYGDAVTVTLKLSETPVVLELDENLMKQVLKNAFDNACQMMQGSGALIIRISAPVSGNDERVQSAGGDWLLEIEDTGPGVPPGQVETVFKPFVSRREGGTGLGLAIVKKIVLIHNGYVEFEKRTAPGAVLRIILPESYDPDRTMTMSREELDQTSDF
ncbi:MAG TPA: ATP-binding protein [bacterium]|nr:ATP-binding protein [bacterium]